MGLFNIIPDNFFSILASKNKEIYLDALFVLRKAYKAQMMIKREELISMLIANLEDRLMDVDDEEDEIPKEKNLSSMAYLLLRKLENAGWIEKEYASNSFEEYINLHDYSIKVLNALYDITDLTSREYNGYVYSTYSVIRTADQDRDDYMYNSLLEAHRKTHEFVDELKSLLNNIRRYHQMISSETQIKQILKGHFDEFKELIGDRIYHPLKTLDSVPRFKNPILSMLKGWMFDKDVLDIMVDSGLVRKNYKDREEALEDIIYMIGDIVDIYERIDDLIREIDRKNAAYTRASVERMQYLLNTDRSMKGKLIEILKTIANDTGLSDKLLVGMEESINAFPVKYIDEFSLYTRQERNDKTNSIPLKVDFGFDEEALEREMEDFRDRIKNSFTHKRIIEFMRNQFKDGMEIESRDFVLKEDEDFIMLILASLKHDEANSFYNIDFNEGYVLNNGYRLPCMKFRRKINDVAGRIREAK